MRVRDRRSITIGNDCRIAGGSQFRDSPGHPLDADARRRGEPPPKDAIKPIVIEDDVWIGAYAVVQAGVRIGRGSVISTRAVVLSDVPPWSLVAGNPARRIGTLAPAPAASGAAAAAESLAAPDRVTMTDPTTETIRAVVARIAKIPLPGSDDDMYVAGLASTDALELLVELEDTFGVTIPDDASSPPARRRSSARW